MVPNCGILLLKNGADGHVPCRSARVTVSRNALTAVGKPVAPRRWSITAIANLKDSHGKPLYDRKHPAKVIISCDKALVLRLTM